MITFKNPYLGNTCVPFQHWVCSVECAQSLEVPARLEQIAKARELDSQYERYVTDCQKSFHRCRRSHPLLTCVLPVDGECDGEAVEGTATPAAGGATGSEAGAVTTGTDSAPDHDTSCETIAESDMTNSSMDTISGLNFDAFKSHKKDKCIVM